jgi:hypothetical protein
MQGLGLVAAASLAPSLVIPSASIVSPEASALGATLVGLVGAALVKVSGVLLHLNGSIAAGEMATWR